MINIKIYQYFCSIIIKFSRLILTPCLTIDSFSQVNVALRHGSIKTCWLRQGLTLLFEIVIPLVHRADKQSRNFASTTFYSFGRKENLAHRNVGHFFVLYAGANSRSIDMEFLLAYPLDTRFDFN